jgi:xylan 1,4-beta-xylosidase
MDRYKVNLRGAVSWSFEFEDQEWFAGFRDLATNGVDKPVLNVFRMFGLMGGKRIAVKTKNGLNAADIITNGVKENNDINAIACKNGNSISIMVWNYHDDEVSGTPAPVELSINGMGKNKVLVKHYRVDQQFSNSFEQWKKMGKPQNVSDEQYTVLQAAGQLQSYTSPEWKQAKNENITVKFDLPRQGVSLVQLSW